METDFENEFYNSYNFRQPRPDGTVRKRLFPTPAPVKSFKLLRTSQSPSSSPLTSSTITNQFFRDQNPPVTPQLVRGEALSSRKRPSVANLEGTPSIRKRIVCTNPDACHARQAADLTAWLNYELVHPLHPSSNGLGNFPQHLLSSDSDFLKQLSTMHRLYHTGELFALRCSIKNDLREVSFQGNVDLSSNEAIRREIVSHILLSYHPAWLLPGLCVLFDTNLAVDLDVALYTARRTNPSARDQFTLMQFLEDVLCTAFLSPRHHLFSSLSHELSGSLSPISPLVAQKNFHCLILQRLLGLIFLLDVSKASHEVFIHADPPLFRHDSSVTSSNEFVSILDKTLFQSDTIQSFLRQHGYLPNYHMPLCEVRRDLRISDLANDLRDGIRLCKLAALFTKDRRMLDRVRVPSPQNLQKEIHDIRICNIQLALRTLLKFAHKTAGEAVEWYASPMEVATGNLPSVLPFLWQLVTLWRDAILIKRSDLSAELDVVKDMFRKNHRKVARLSQSPTAEMALDELSPSVDSPSNLRIYEKCSNQNSALLLQWSAIICGMFGLAVRDFYASFRDGTALSLMLHFYHPDILSSDEIVHVTAAEVRAPEAAEAELAHAQNNFNLFISRIRGIGAFPNMAISAESALNGGTLAIEKQQSFGRLMDVMLSYLFRHIVLRRESAHAQAETELLMEKAKSLEKQNLAVRVIVKSLRHLRVQRRLERIHTTRKETCGALQTPSMAAGRSPLRGQLVNRLGVFSPSKPPRFATSPGKAVGAFGQSPRQQYLALNSGSIGNPGSSKISSFLALSSGREESFPSGGSHGSPPYKLFPGERSISGSRGVPLSRQMRDDAERRKLAAVVITKYYKAWRCRCQLKSMIENVIFVQACGRAFLARKAIRDLGFKKQFALRREEERFLPGENEESFPPYGCDMAKVFSPANASVQLTMEVLPRVQEHMRALERFISRMESEEMEIAEASGPLDLTKTSPSLLGHHGNAAAPDMSKRVTSPCPETYDEPRKVLPSVSDGSSSLLELPPDSGPEIEVGAPTTGQMATLPSTEMSMSLEETASGDGTNSCTAPGVPAGQSLLEGRNEVERRKTWRELALAAAAGGASLLAQAVLHNLSTITNHIDSTLHEGSAALYLSARKPVRQSRHSEGVSVASESVFRTVRLGQEANGNSAAIRPVLVAPVTDNDTPPLTDGSDNDDDPSFQTEAMPPLNSVLPADMAHRCNEAAYMVGEVSARKENLNSMLAKIRREEANEGRKSQRGSISLIERQLADLDKASEVLMSKLGYIQGLSSKCEDTFNHLDPVGGGTRANEGPMDFLTTTKEISSEIPISEGERLSARLSDAEEAYEATMANLVERDSSRYEAVFHLRQIEGLDRNICSQSELDLGALYTSAGAALSTYESSAAFIELTTDTIESECAKCEKLLSSSASETWVSDTQDSEVDISEAQGVYVSVVSDRLCERLENAESAFCSKLVERKFSSLKQWLNRMGFVMLLRELKESLELDNLAFQTEVDHAAKKASDLENRYALYSNKVKEESGTGETVDQLSSESWLLMDSSAETFDYRTITDITRSFDTQLQSLMSMRLIERLELANERFRSEMFIRRVFHIGSWCESKEKELHFRSGLKSLEDEGRAVVQECSQATFEDLEDKRFDIEDGLNQLSSKTYLSLAEIPRDYGEDVSDVVGEELFDCLSEFDTVYQGILEERFVEVLEAAEDSYLQCMCRCDSLHYDKLSQTVANKLGNLEVEGAIAKSLVGEKHDCMSIENSRNDLDARYLKLTEWCANVQEVVDRPSESGMPIVADGTTEEKYDSSLEKLLKLSDNMVQEISCDRFAEILELAQERFSHKMRNHWTSNLERWLKKKEVEISIRSMNEGLRVNDLAYENEIEALATESHCSRVLFDSLCDEVDCLTGLAECGVSHIDFPILMMFENDTDDDDPYKSAIRESEAIVHEVYVSRMGERLSEAEEVFQEAMVCFRRSDVENWLKRADLKLRSFDLNEEWVGTREKYLSEVNTLMGCVADLELMHNCLNCDFIEEMLSQYELLNESYDEIEDELDQGGPLCKGVEVAMAETELLLDDLDSERANDVQAALSLVRLSQEKSPAQVSHVMHDTILAKKTRMSGENTTVRDHPSEVEGSKESASVASHEAGPRCKLVAVSEGNDYQNSPSQTRPPTPPTVMNRAGNSLLMMGFFNGRLSTPWVHEEEDFVSLSSFATSKNSSRQSAGNDFVSLSSFGTNRFSSGNDMQYLSMSSVKKATQTPTFQYHHGESLGGFSDTNMQQGYDALSPGIALWKIGDTPTHSREEILGRLSVELDAIRNALSPDGMEMVMGDAGSTRRLQGVMRRISLATGSPFHEERPIPNGSEKAMSTSCVNIARILFVVMRSCIRSEEYTTLVRLGMKIIQDLCTVQERMCDIVGIEESVDVISTCVQFYRDDKDIFRTGVEVLYMISEDTRGVVLLKEGRDIVKRLSKVNALMTEHLQRSQRNMARKRQANIVLSVLAKRKGIENVKSSLADEIRKASEGQTPSEDELYEAMRKLEVVVQRGR